MEQITEQLKRLLAVRSYLTVKTKFQIYDVDFIISVTSCLLEMLHELLVGGAGFSLKAVVRQLLAFVKKARVQMVGGVVCSKLAAQIRYKLRELSLFDRRSLSAHSKTQISVLPESSTPKQRQQGALGSSKDLSLSSVRCTDESGSDDDALLAVSSSFDDSLYNKGKIGLSGQSSCSSQCELKTNSAEGSMVSGHGSFNSGQFADIGVFSPSQPSIGTSSFEKLRAEMHITREASFDSQPLVVDSLHCNQADKSSAAMHVIDGDSDVSVPIPRQAMVSGQSFCSPQCELKTNSAEGGIVTGDGSFNSGQFADIGVFSQSQPSVVTSSCEKLRAEMHITREASFDSQPLVVDSSHCNQADKSSAAMHVIDGDSDVSVTIPRLAMVGGQCQNPLAVGTSTKDIGGGGLAEAIMTKYGMEKHVIEEDRLDKLVCDMLLSLSDGRNSNDCVGSGSFCVEPYGLAEPYSGQQQSSEGVSLDDELRSQYDVLNGGLNGGECLSPVKAASRCQEVANKESMGTITASFGYQQDDVDNSHCSGTSSVHEDGVVEPYVGHDLSSQGVLLNDNLGSKNAESCGGLNVGECLNQSGVASSGDKVANDEAKGNITATSGDQQDDVDNVGFGVLSGDLELSPCIDGSFDGFSDGELFNVQTYAAAMSCSEQCRSSKDVSQDHNLTEKVDAAEEPSSEYRQSSVGTLECDKFSAEMQLVDERDGVSNVGGDVLNSNNPGSLDGYNEAGAESLSEQQQSSMEVSQCDNLTVNVGVDEESSSEHRQLSGITLQCDEFSAGIHVVEDDGLTDDVLDQMISGGLLNADNGSSVEGCNETAAKVPSEQQHLFGGILECDKFVAGKHGDEEDNNVNDDDLNEMIGGVVLNSVSDGSLDGCDEPAGEVIPLFGESSSDSDENDEGAPNSFIDDETEYEDYSSVDSEKSTPKKKRRDNINQGSCRSKRRSTASSDGSESDISVKQVQRKRVRIMDDDSCSSPNI